MDDAIHPPTQHRKEEALHSTVELPWGPVGCQSGHVLLQRLSTKVGSATIEVQADRFILPGCLGHGVSQASL